MKRSTYLYAVTAGVCLVLSLTLATSLVRAQEPTAQGGYKIGVVDMLQVFQKYEKREAQFQDLVQKRNEAQAKVDAMAEQINKKRETYESKKLTASKEELDNLELEI